MKPWSNVKVPHLARKVWVRSLFSLKGMYRTLLATCGSANVLGLYLYIRYIQWVQTPYSHLASKVRYITHLGVLTHLSFPLRTNSVLTPCKQGAVLSRYSIALAMRTNSLLTPCKQGAVLSRYSMALAMSTNSLLTRCEQRAVHYSPRSTYSPFLSA